MLVTFVRRTICNSSGQHDDTALNIEMNCSIFFSLLAATAAAPFRFHLFVCFLCCWQSIDGVEASQPVDRSCIYSEKWKLENCPVETNKFTAEHGTMDGKWQMANETLNMLHYITFRSAIFNFMNVQKQYEVKKSTYTHSKSATTAAPSECGWEKRGRNITWKLARKKKWEPAYVSAQC